MTNTPKTIRSECLRPGDSFERPSPEEIRAVLELAGLSGAGASDYLGLGRGGGRTVRRWTGGDSHIPYAAWALLCHAAGLGEIWKHTPY